MMRSLRVYLSATTSLALSCAGAGVLAFPWALNASRLPTFLGAGAIVVTLSILGMRVLTAHAASNDAWSYERVMYRAIGPRTAVAVVACIMM